MNCREAIDMMGDVLEGGGSAGPMASFEEHIAECAPCRNYLDHLRLTREALSRLRRAGGTSPRRSELLARFTKELGREGH